MLCYVIKWSHFLFTDMNRADNQKTKAVIAIKFSSTFQTLWLKFQVMITSIFVNPAFQDYSPFRRPSILGCEQALHAFGGM